LTLPMRRTLRVVWLVFDGLLIAAFACGYAARYVHPRNLWWIQVPAIGLLYLSLAVLVATLVVAWQRRWWVLGLHLFLCLLVAFRFLPGSRLGQPPLAPEARFTLLTLNARHEDGRSGALAALIGQEQPHLIAMQEHFVHFKQGRAWLGRDPFPISLDSLGYFTLKPGMFPRGRHGATIYRLDLPVLSRIPLDDVTPLNVDDDSAGETDDRAVSVTKAHFQWQGRPAVLYNVQLRSFIVKPWHRADRWWMPSIWLEAWRAYRDDFLIRAAQAEEVRQLINRERLPVIVCGDFNSTPHNWAAWHLIQGMHDAFEVAGHGKGATYYAHLPLFRIDYVLVSDEFSIDAAWIGRVTKSDHLPLIVELGWRVQ